jgi:hypothetical protein
MTDEIIPPSEGNPQPTTPTPQIPAEADHFMKGLEAAAKLDIARNEAEKKEVDKAFEDLDKKGAEPEKPKDASAELKLTVPVEPVKPEDLNHELSDDFKVPSRRADWDKFREDRNRIYREKEELRKQLEEVKTKSANPEEVAALRKERDELAAQYKEASVVNDPNLTADIDRRLDSTIKLAKGALTDPAKAEGIEAVMKMPRGPYRDKAMAELFEDIPAWQQSLVAAHIATADQALFERDGRIQSARQNADAILNQRKQAAEAQKQARANKVEKVFSDVTNEFKTKDGWKDIMANPELAGEVEREARNTFSGGVQDEAELGRKAYHAAMAPMIMRAALELTKRNSEMEATIAKLKGSSPTINTTGGPSSAPKENDFLSDKVLARLMQ